MDTYDLEIEDLEIGRDSMVDENGSYKSLVFDLLVWVKNHSKTTIDTFFLNWESSVNSSCEGQKKGQMVARKITPNQTLKLIVTVSDSFVEAGIDYEICISSSSPNRHYDLVAGNNTRCTSLDLPPLSVNTTSRNSFSSQNFARRGGFLNISQSVDDLSVEMIGVNGHSVSLPMINNGVLIPASCHPGFYFLRIRDSQGVFSRKILVID